MNAANEFGPDSGITLVELIVYVVISLIIAAIMAGILSGGLRAQANATDRDTATGRAAVIAASLGTSIRNATAVSPATGTTTTLIAVVATGTSSWQCRAWALTSSGSLVYKAAAAKFATTSTTGWTVLATGVKGTLTGSAPFQAVSSTQIAYGLSVTVNSTVVPLSGGVIAQATSAGAGPCW